MQMLKVDIVTRTNAPESRVIQADMVESIRYDWSNVSSNPNKEFSELTMVSGESIRVAGIVGFKNGDDGCYLTFTPIPDKSDVYLYIGINETHDVILKYLVDIENKAQDAPDSHAIADCLSKETGFKISAAEAIIKLGDLLTEGYIRRYLRTTKPTYAIEPVGIKYVRDECDDGEGSEI